MIEQAYPLMIFFLRHNYNNQHYKVLIIFGHRGLACQRQGSTLSKEDLLSFCYHFFLFVKNLKNKHLTHLVVCQKNVLAADTKVYDI